jgi:hypothetical protein
LIRALHKNFEDLAHIPSTTDLQASSFANCEVMKDRLDKVFCDDAAALFQALPLMRKQVICAVLSGEDPLPSDPSTLSRWNRHQ